MAPLFLRMAEWPYNQQQPTAANSEAAPEWRRPACYSSGQSAEFVESVESALSDMSDLSDSTAVAHLGALSYIAAMFMRAIIGSLSTNNVKRCTNSVRYGYLCTFKRLRLWRL